MIGGNIGGNAYMDRIIDVGFHSYFTEDSTLCNDKEFIFKKDNNLVSSIFHTNHRYALFKILSDYAKEYINN